jgi:hypothetical protein
MVQFESGVGHGGLYFNANSSFCASGVQLLDDKVVERDLGVAAQRKAAAAQKSIRGDT